MNAIVVVDKLLEAEPDDLMGEVNRYMETFDFDTGAADILQDARELYKRLMADGTISTLLNQGRRANAGTFDESAVAQAIIRRAIERRGSRGAERAYKSLKRLNYHSF